MAYTAARALFGYSDMGGGGGGTDTDTVAGNVSEANHAQTPEGFVILKDFTKRQKKVKQSRVPMPPRPHRGPQRGLRGRTEAVYEGQGSACPPYAFVCVRPRAVSGRASMGLLSRSVWDGGV
jgi:hypothetical protein